MAWNFKGQSAIHAGLESGCLSGAQARAGPSLTAGHGGLLSGASPGASLSVMLVHVELVVRDARCPEQLL